MMETLQDKPKPPLHEWAEKYLRLPSETTDLDGPFSMYYVPHLYGIFAALDDPDTHEISCMKAAQVAWTTALIAYLLREIDCDPGPMIAMFAAEQAARDFSTEKLEPTVGVTPAVAKKVSHNKRDGSSVQMKKFRNGFLKLVGSNSPRSVKSTPARIAIVEEPDDSTENLKEQGDSILLLWERTKRLRNSKRILGGTPKTDGLSRVQKHCDASDKRVLPIACHDCGEKHVLSFDNVSWLESETGDPHPVYNMALPESAVYVCPHCGSTWDDYRRHENIRNTVKAAIEVGDPLCGWQSTREFTGHAGFVELCELYCCLPGSPLSDLVRDYLDSEYRARQGDENAKIVFINSKLGRPYTFDSGALEADSLRQHAENSFKELVCPRQGFLVTVGIDVQHDRVAIIVKAWGRGEEHWTLYWGEIPASQTMVDRKDKAWEALEQLVYSQIEHESGVNIYAEAVSIDSSDGQTNDAVYSWVRSMHKKYRKVLTMAIKGSSATTDPEIFVQPSPGKSIDHKNPKRKTKADKYGLKPYIVGTNKAKNWLEAELKLLVKGLGKFHIYEGIRDDYWDQMCGEVKAPHRKVKNRLVWQPRPGRAIEAWDCEQYALHAARAKRVHLLTPAAWDALELKLTQADMFSAPVAAPEPGIPSVEQVKPIPAKGIQVKAAGTSNQSSLLEEIARELNG